jgi:hypothetical protein
MLCYSKLKSGNIKRDCFILNISINKYLHTYLTRKCGAYIFEEPKKRFCTLLRFNIRAEKSHSIIHRDKKITNDVYNK